MEWLLIQSYQILLFYLGETKTVQLLLIKKINGSTIIQNESKVTKDASVSGLSDIKAKSNNNSSTIIIRESHRAILISVGIIAVSLIVAAGAILGYKINKDEKSRKEDTIEKWKA